MITARLLPAARRATMPWRNGGGTTETVAAWPADSGPEAFGWRLSIAEVTAEGPFSRFPGVDRHLAILHGRLELRFGDGSGVVLDAGSEPLVFAGDVDVVGAPRDGAARDLNLMLDRADYRGSMRRVSGGLVRDARSAATVLVAVGGATIACGDASFDLSHTDAIMLDDETREIAVDGAAWLVDIRARDERR